MSCEENTGINGSIAAVLNYFCVEEEVQSHNRDCFNASRSENATLKT